MMKNYALIKAIIDELEVFENTVETGNNPESEFAVWLLQRKTMRRPLLIQTDTDNGTQNMLVSELEISSLLIALFKYAKHYTKRVLEGTLIKTIDEFGFLMSLHSEVSLSKTELIQRNLIEIPSGNEIIKRLIRDKLIEESPDPFDKRAKQVKLTALGREFIVKIFNRMNVVSYLLSGNLPPAEKESLAVSMRKLKIFHQLIHQNDKETDIDEILEKYVGKTATQDDLK